MEITPESFHEDRRAAGSDEYHVVADAYRSARDKLDHTPRDEPVLRVMADTTLGNLKERLSVISYANEQPNQGLRHSKHAKNHYFWADDWQRRLSETQIDNPLTQFHRGATLFDHARSLVTHAMLNLITYDRHPEAYGYLETDRRNHEGMVRHLHDVVEASTIIGHPRIDGRLMADALQGVNTIKEMDLYHERARRHVPYEPYGRQMLERTKRSERLVSGFMAFAKYLER